MATRFYLNTYGWAPVRPTPNAGWETTRALESGHSRRIMYPWRSSGPDIGPSAVEVQNAVHDILMAQYISEPLAAQTISGTIRAVIQAGENNASANWRSQMHAWVMAPDGSSRGTLTTFNTGGLSNEWTASTSTLRSAFFPVGSTGTTVTNVNALAGDRIVVEVGARSHDTSATTFSGRIRLGDGHFSSPGTNWDLPSNQTDTSTSRNGWIEFSANLTFQTAETAITDNIADAVDAMPAAEGHVIARVADISTFTAEADDPTDIGNYNNSGDTDFSGWIKLVGPAGGARVKIQPTCGLGLDVMAFVFDGVPDSSSVAEQIYPDVFSGDPIPLFVDVPFGTTKYVCVQPKDGSFQTFSLGDKNIQVILSRGRAGGMSDSIADAPDVLPAVQDTSVSAFQPDYDFFSSEADDPQWISDEYFGDPLNFTAWVKLVVPSSGIKVNIDTYLPIDYIEGPTGTYLFVFDGVPDSASVPIAVGDNNTDSNPPAGSIDQNWAQKSKITDLSLESGHTYYICAMTWDGPFWEHWEEGTNLQITVYRHLDGGLTTEDDFGVDAIVRKVMADPIYLGTPTYVDSTSAAVDTGSTITLAAPTGLQQGDVMVAVINAATPSVSFNSMTSAGWTSLGSPSFATSPINHLLYSFYRFVDDDPSTSWVFSHQIGSSTPVSSAKAGAVVAFRDAGVPILRTSNGTTTVSTGNKVTPSWSVLSNDPNYLSPITVLLAWAGGSAGTTTWTPGTGVTEREDVSATSLASLMVGTGNDFLDNSIGSRFATPSQAEHNQTQVIQITGRTAVFGISALLLPGFPINAYIQAATHTTHPRTGPHTGTHLDTAIVTSATLGSLPAGTDLHTVLMDLDAMLTDLENQS